MILPRRDFLRLAAGAAALPITSRTAQAQAYPARTVRIVVGFPAGGGADATARIVGASLSEVWGSQAVIENKAGAGGNIAHDMVAHAPPDGYTLLMGTSSLPANRFLFPSLTYDPVGDFAPVSLIGTYPNMVVVPASSEVKSLQDFIAKCKRDRVTFATPGVGTVPHLVAELFKRVAGIEMTHIPYRGVAAGAMNDLLAGRIDAMFNTTGSLLQSVRAGQTRGLAVTSGKRDASAPDIPTFAESGVAGFDVSGWYAIFAPAKTPPEIVKRINADMVKGLASPVVKARFEPLGVTVGSSTSEELARAVKKETDLWGPIIKEANIRGE